MISTRAYTSPLYPLHYRKYELKKNGESEEDFVNHHHKPIEATLKFIKKQQRTRVQVIEEFTSFTKTHDLNFKVSMLEDGFAQGRFFNCTSGCGTP